MLNPKFLNLNQNSHNRLKQFYTILDFSNKELRKSYKSIEKETLQQIKILIQSTSFVFHLSILLFLQYDPDNSSCQVHADFHFSILQYSTFHPAKYKTHVRVFYHFYNTLHTFCHLFTNKSQIRP